MVVYRCTREGTVESKTWARKQKEVDKTRIFPIPKRYYTVEKLVSYLFMIFEVQSCCNCRTSVMIAGLFPRRTRGRKRWKKRRQRRGKKRGIKKGENLRGWFKKPPAVEERLVFIAVGDCLSRHWCEEKK